jgi:chloride channel 3/4/5
MISVMISKWIADALGPDGIYASWIALRRYPWLTPFEFQDNGEIASDVMTPADKLVVLHEGTPLSELSTYIFPAGVFIELTHTRTERVLDTWKYHGFPVVRDGILLGYVAREKLKSFIGSCFAFIPAVADWLNLALQSLSSPRPAQPPA